jgi:transcriptional regulator with PAS, ATPase and Fis domain
MVSDIAVIAPDVDLMGQFEKIRRETVTQFSLRKGLFEEAIVVARELVAQGAKILVSRGETTTQIRSAISVPVVDIPINVHDVIPLIDQARNYSRRIAVVGFGAIVRAAQVAAPILSVELSIFKLHSTLEIPDVVAKVKEMGLTVLVGNPQSATLAETFGIKGFKLRSQDAMLLAALDEAAKLAEVVRRENEWRIRQQVFIDTAREGILVLDDRGRLLHSNQWIQLDPGIERAFFVPEEGWLRLRPGELMDAVRGGETWTGVHEAEGGAAYVCRVHPVAREGQNFGAVVLLEKERGQDQPQRRDVFQKGLVAQHRLEDIVHESPAMRELLARARQYAGADSTVLVLGESGTGKELVAQSLHNASRRRHGPFVAVNCAALPENLLESELFGYQEGAFTGARRGGKKGFFELADSGTLFLDEIGEMALPMQVKLLRVLEERQIMRIGGERVIAVDVRLVCASNRDLARLVALKQFRQDLYFRINVLRLRLPPLRERGSCLEALIRHFLKEIGGRLDGPTSALAPEAWGALRRHPYPGNVRELKSTIERLLVTCQGRTITEADVAACLDETAETACAEALPAVEGELLQSEEMRLIRRVLGECGGNRAQAARRLGISTTTLWRRLARGPRQ